MHEDDGFDFDMNLQSQKANTSLHADMHCLDSLDSSDDKEDSVGLEVNSHWFKGSFDPNSD